MQILQNALPFQPIRFKDRLKLPPTKAEFASLVFSVGMLIIFAILSERGWWATHDFDTYLDTATGDFGGYFYPHWWLPVFAGLAKLPHWLGYALWGLLNLFGVWFGVRVFGGHMPITLLSYQLLYSLGYGQIVGVVVLGVALTWWGLQNERWQWVGLGLILATTKPQSGFALVLFLWLTTRLDWQARLKTLILPFSIALLSLIVYPNWPLDLWAQTQAVPPDTLGSITLWRWLGPGALFFFLPLFIKMEKDQRFALFAVTLALVAPYYQQTDLLLLYMLPIGWLAALLGNAGYLFVEFQWVIFQYFWVIPALVYGAIILPEIASLFNKTKKNRVV